MTSITSHAFTSNELSDMEIVFNFSANYKPRTLGIFSWLELIFRGFYHARYQKNFRIIILAIALACLINTVSIANPIIPLPKSITASTLTITVEVTEGVELIGNPNAVATAQTITNATTLATTVKAIQESVGLPQTAASAISLHTTTADANIVVGIADKVRTGGAPSSNLIVDFTISQSTSAMAFAAEPLFARSMAFSQGAAGWIGLQDVGSTDAALSLTWDFDDLQLQASPIGSLAYIRNTMTILQATSQGQLRHDEVGFLSYLINDELTTRVFDLPGSSTVSNWLLAPTNFNQSQDTLTLDLDSTPLNLSIPLAFSESFNALALAILSTHTQISYEAPPRAVVQVEAAAGYRTTGTDSDPRVHWDPFSGTLAFDPIPIELLLGSGNLSGNPSISPNPTAMDPLLGGFLEIDPFTYLNELDGRQYYSGGNLKLSDSAKNPVLTAIAPTLVLEDALYAHQGFNGFAPVLMFEQNSESVSSWLKDFLGYLNIDSLYLPELFIGFDAPFGNNQSQPFSVPVSAFLSFADPFSSTVPEPSTLWLLCGGLMLLALLRAHARSVSSNDRRSADRFDSLMAPQRFM